MSARSKSAYVYGVCVHDHVVPLLSEYESTNETDPSALAIFHTKEDAAQWIANRTYPLAKVVRLKLTRSAR